MLPPLRALKAFEAVARLGSIGSAAKELHVTSAAISQQLKSLELFLEAKLFTRTPRGMVLTTKAQKYLPIVAGSLHHLSLQTEILFQSPRDEVLRLKVNHTFCYSWLMPRLADFMAQYPSIHLDISLVDWPSTIPCEQADIELTNGYVEAENVKIEKLFQEQWVLVASPEYKAKYASALDAGEFAGLPAIQVKGYEENWLQWLNHNHFSLALPKIQLEITNSMQAIQAAKCGLGMLLIRSLAVKESLNHQQVVLAHHAYMPTESAHYLITPKNDNAKINFFCNWLHEQVVKDGNDFNFSELNKC